MQILSHLILSVGPLLVIHIFLVNSKLCQKSLTGDKKKDEPKKKNDKKKQPPKDYILIWLDHMKA